MAYVLSDTGPSAGYDCNPGTWRRSAAGNRDRGVPCNKQPCYVVTLWLQESGGAATASERPPVPKDCSTVLTLAWLLNRQLNSS